LEHRAAGAAEQGFFDMIRNVQPAPFGIEVHRATDPRRRARRMRILAIMVTAVVGLSGGLLQQFHHQANLNAGLGQAEAPIPTAPFAYFPR